MTLATDPAATPMPVQGMRMAVELGPSCVAVLDASGRILWANRRWPQERSIAFEGLVGSPAERLWLGADGAERSRLVQRAAQLNRPIRFQEWVRDRAFDTVIAPLEGGQMLIISTPGAMRPETWPEHLPQPEVVELGRSGGGRVAGLSRREREVLSLLASGLTIKEVASKFGRSEKTIEGHRDAIYRKLGVTNRSQATRLAIQAGLAAPGAGAE